jgi:hypothetical protein
MKEFDPDKTTEDYEKEYKEELKFDRYRLDEEYERQPELYMDWAKLYGQVRRERKWAEREVDRVKATIGLKVRRDSEELGLGKKPTEAAIKEIILTSEEVIEAQNYFFQVYELVYILEGAVKAFEQRKELLKGCGELWKGGYYSSVPEVVEDLSERAENKKELSKSTRRRKLKK